MPDLFEEITQGLIAPQLDLIGMERSPDWIGNYQTSNVLVNTLAHLVATDGRFSRLVRCDEDSILPVRIRDGDGTYLADVDATGELNVGVGNQGRRAEVMYPVEMNGSEYGLVIASFQLEDILTILADVHNAVDHALTTKEAV